MARGIVIIAIVVSSIVLFWIIVSLMTVDRTSNIPISWRRAVVGGSICHPSKHEQSQGDDSSAMREDATVKRQKIGTVSATEGWEGKKPASNVSKGAIAVNPYERSDNDDALPANISAAVVYLVEGTRDASFFESLVLLKRNFLARFNYPVIAFHENKDYKGGGMQHLHRFATALGIDLRLRVADFTLPDNFKPGRDKEVVWGGRTGYKLMIRFWFRNIFRDPFMEQFDYYMRLDTDSFIQSPITVNPFEFMKQNNKTYAYRLIRQEAANVILGMTDFVAEYSRNHATMADRNNLTSYLRVAADKKSRDSYAPQVFYNNFEIVSLTRFRQEDIVNFTEAVDASKRIFTHRWGDAPLRFYEALLFLDWKEEVWEFCSFVYEHRETWRKC